MKTLARNLLQRSAAGIVSLILCSGQFAAAQTYLNINFANSTNKYSLLTEVASITFNGSGGIIFTKTDNSSGTETLNLLGSITLDGSSGGGSPLPAELVSFTASTEQQRVALRWRTAAEKNNYGFEIERAMVHEESIVDDWSTAGFVEGHGTTNAPNEYSFTDTKLSGGTYLYRLKQIDRDGRFEYSDEVDVTVTGAPTQFSMEQNYPNPFNPATGIRYQLASGGMTTLIVYDALGRTAAILVNNVKDAGTYTATFDGSKLSSGVYYAQLQSGGNVQLIKMQMLK